MGYAPFKFAVTNDGTIAIWDKRGVVIWSNGFHRTCAQAEIAYQKEYGGKWADFVETLHKKPSQKKVWRGPRCTSCEEANKRYRARYPHVGKNIPGWHQMSTRKSEDNIWNGLDDCWKPPAASDKAVPGAPGQQQQQKITPSVPKPKPIQDVNMDNSSIPSDNIFIDDGRIKIGFNMSRGAGIYYISESNSQNNLINNFDTGRLIQQSFYGNEDGSAWPGAGPNGSAKPWAWNPVQGGSYDGQVSRINRWGTARNCFRSSVTPRNWAGKNMIEEVTMEQTVCILPGAVARCHFVMKYTGSTHHAPREHEMPAVFVDWSLHQLISYAGNAPWTNQPLSTITPPPQHGPINNDYHNDLTEHWAAWVNDSGLGIGIYFPHTTRITCYKYEVPGNHGASCCYLAPLVASGLAPGATVEYDVYVAIGNVNAIRETFSSLKS